MNRYRYLTYPIIFRPWQRVRALHKSGVIKIITKDGIYVQWDGHRLDEGHLREDYLSHE